MAAEKTTINMEYTGGMHADPKGLEEAIGYAFCDRDLLIKALTHPSWGTGDNYERLEFLGDAVIELAASNYLFNRFPNAGEGELTKRRAGLVCSDAMAAAARRIGLGQYILLGKGEIASGGREKKSVLENAFEALVGAVFLDGGIGMAGRIAENLLISLPEVAQETIENGDYKSKLQEKLQAEGAADIVYLTYLTQGPPHDAVFFVRLYIGGKPVSEGRGKTKKQAEQDAAKNAIHNLK